MYADYDFYVNSFHGELIAEDKWDKWADEASDELDYITMDRIDADILAAYETKIGKATCALAELFYQIDELTKHASDTSLSGNIKSRSSGGESITFASTQTALSAAAADVKAKERLAFDTVRRYLAGTGLLFQGV